MVPLFSWHVRLGSALLLVAMNFGIAPLQSFQSVSAQTKPLPVRDRKTSFLLAQSSVAETVDKIARQITVRIDSTKSGNGSGVIVAKQGTTYYVLTAEHVVPKPDDYTLTTPMARNTPSVLERSRN
ncbi:MAG: trypsin-like peptidase domain-containing protein [Acaryochloridaceae cyanobacterium RU_4_10]|nr:trypsin-like peptidase domain-containing protein [Acaryochloridaceae cyanobacterium RU_4_10]